MAQYSIKDLEKLTGIKAHTIRIWEKRYNAIQPSRTTTNIRYYCDDDLRKLLNISILNRHGVKISHIMHKSNGEILRMVEDIGKVGSHYESLIESLTLAMIELDEIKFERIFTNTIIKHGFENTIINVIYPLLDKVGILWQIGTINPAQEHFISNLIRQKLIVAIDGEAKAYTPNHKTFILFLPEGELHEFGLLFYYFLLRKAGHKAIYLGQTVPYNDLMRVAEIEKDFDFITSFVTNTPIDEIQSYLMQLGNDFKNHDVYVVGEKIKQIEADLPGNITKISSIFQFKDLLNIK